MTPAPAHAQKPNASNLRDYYDALHALSAEEQTVLGELHAQAVSHLKRRFSGSRKDTEARGGDPAEPFHDNQRDRPPDPPPPADAISDTIGFAAHLVDGQPRVIEGCNALNFRYVDREIFLARTKGDRRVPARRLDLLLANADDGTPILAELKRGDDSLPYPALIQLLLHAAELSAGPQLGRLHGQYPTLFAQPSSAPPMDLYLIYYEPPPATFRERSFSAARRVAEQLVQPAVCGETIRRIAYIEAIPDADHLRFEPKFQFGT